MDVVNVLFRCRISLLRSPHPEHIEEGGSELLSTGEVEDKLDGAVDVINDGHNRIHHQVVVVMLVRVIHGRVRRFAPAWRHPLGGGWPWTRRSPGSRRTWSITWDWASIVPASRRLTSLASASDARAGRWQSFLWWGHYRRWWHRTGWDLRGRCRSSTTDQLWTISRLDRCRIR